MQAWHTRRTSILARLAAAAMVLAGTVVGGSSAFAAAPQSLHFEGFLKSTSGGAATDGDYDLTFSLYDSPSANSATWSEKAKVTVKGGQFSHVLGSVNALSPSVFAGSSAAGAIGIQVGSDPELARQPLHAVAYALNAATASSISCTACVSVSALKFDDNLDLGNNGIKAGTITGSQISAQTLTAQTVTAQSFVGDGSKLTGIKTASGSCPSGKVVIGINADGTLSCASTAASLPKDGLDEVSNKMLTTQFIENYAMGASDKGLKIPDNTGIEAISTITVPSVGIAEEFLKVTVDISNSDLSTVALVLLPPDDKKTGYILCDPCGAQGEKVLKTTFPTPSKTKTGDLNGWLGKNPAGTWNLKVKDTSYCIPQLDKVNCDAVNGTDGKINDWSVSFQVLSSSKAQVNGDLVVTGTVFSSGTEVQLGAVAKACDASKAGVVRYNNGAFEGCDGATWTRLGASKGSIYRWATWTTYDANGGWWMGNNSTMYAGIAPSSWSSGAIASSVSSTTEVLNTLFWQKGPAIDTVSNSTVWSLAVPYGHSSESHHAGAIFRIKNTTASDITWTAYWYRTAYGGWGDYASIALNGTNIWSSGGSTYYGNAGASQAITIPKNRTSTVIFVSSAGPSYNYMRPLTLAFYNNCLKLPPGLEFVDDLDTKPNGWTN